MWGDWVYGGWAMGVGMVMMLLFWAVLVIGAVALIRWMLRPGGGAEGRGAGSGPDALAILRERYARGDITRDEFERMKRDLLE